MFFPINPLLRQRYNLYLLDYLSNYLARFPHLHLSTTSLQKPLSVKAGSAQMRFRNVQLSKYYQAFNFEFPSLMHKTLGSNSKMPKKTLSKSLVPREQMQRIFSTLTLTVRCLQVPPPALWIPLLLPPEELLPLSHRHRAVAITWTTCWESLMPLHQPRKIIMA